MDIVFAQPSCMEKRSFNATERKINRRQELARKKQLDEAIRGAYIRKDHLSEFPAFVNYNCSGVSVTLESSRGSSLSGSLKQYIIDLLEINMKGAYGREWPEEEKAKRRGMIAADTLYIIARLNEDDICQEDRAVDGDMPIKENRLWKGGGAPVVAFVQYRFVVEEELPVLYLYEIQLEKVVQGKGLGKFLMQLLELIAQKNNMKAIVLTNQKSNVAALNFYTNKLSYKIASYSPSMVDPLAHADCSYEILCKTLDAHTKLAVSRIVSTADSAPKTP